ncbi:MAG: hypothetical protein O3A92_10765 [Verrucomicrobia bacterium]|nr:hypothetical protein [Verrucomicrobiota bacterium]
MPEDPLNKFDNWVRDHERPPPGLPPDMRDEVWNRIAAQGQKNAFAAWLEGTFLEDIPPQRLLAAYCAVAVLVSTVAGVVLGSLPPPTKPELFPAVTAAPELRILY